MKTAIAVLAVALALPAFAQDTSGSTTDKMMKKGMNSDTTKNYSAKALSKIGMDITPSPSGAKAYIIEPKNGAEVTSPVKVLFGLSGMGIAPAGTQVDNTGHHHLLIDGPTVEMNAALKKTDQIQHFGGGQTETTVKLKPGKHTLQLLLGDWKHQPHNPPVQSETITITVK
jgi:hypothetical protein